jgi:hypothetical protein
MGRRVGDVRAWCVDSAEEVWLLCGSGLLCHILPGSSIRAPPPSRPLAASSKRPVAQLRRSSNPKAASALKAA